MVHSCIPGTALKSVRPGPNVQAEAATTYGVSSLLHAYQRSTIVTRATPTAVHAPCAGTQRFCTMESAWQSVQQGLLVPAKGITTCVAKSQQHATRKPTTVTPATPTRVRAQCAGTQLFFTTASATTNVQTACRFLEREITTGGAFHRWLAHQRARIATRATMTKVHVPCAATLLSCLTESASTSVQRAQQARAKGTTTGGAKVQPSRQPRCRRRQRHLEALQRQWLNQTERTANQPLLSQASEQQGNHRYRQRPRQMRQAVSTVMEDQRLNHLPARSRPHRLCRLQLNVDAANACVARLLAKSKSSRARY